MDSLFINIILPILFIILFSSVGMRFWIKVSDLFVINFSFTKKSALLRQKIYYPWYLAIVKYIISFITVLFFLGFVPKFGISIVTSAFFILISILFGSLFGAIFWAKTSSMVTKKHHATPTSKIIFYKKDYKHLIIFLFSITAFLMAIVLYIVLKSL